jgi:hypothetical protein
MALKYFTTAQLLSDWLQVGWLEFYSMQKQGYLSSAPCPDCLCNQSTGHWRHFCQCRNYRYVTLCLPSCIHLHSMVIDDLVLCNGITSGMITNCFNRKGCGRKYSQPDLRDYLGSCLEGLRKSIKTLEQDSLSLGWEFNLRCLKYKAGLPTTRPPLSVPHITSAGTPYLNTMLVAVEMFLPPYILMARYSSGRTFHFL